MKSDRSVSKVFASVVLTSDDEGSCSIDKVLGKIQGQRTGSKSGGGLKSLTVYCDNS